MSSTATTEDSVDDSRTLAEMKKMMLDSKVDGNKSVWQMTLETFGMADGKNKRGDITLESLDQALGLLNEYVNAKQESNHVMDLVPLKEFNATQDDFLLAFLKWAESEDPTTKKQKINVSKAQRRLDAYFEWMKDNKAEFEEPLTIESIEEAAKVWNIQITYDDDNHFLWWIDLGAIDKKELKKLSNSAHLRYVVWFTHVVMLDKRAQDNGAMIVEDMGQMGFFQMATLVPSDLSAKMDRLTVGIVPVRMKAIYIFGAARWMSLLIGFMKPFMSKKMAARFNIIPAKTDKQKFCDDLVKRKNIPKDYMGLQGEVPKDKVFESFKK